jgi:uncharacterized membrane protein (UPF0127 family)
MVMQGRWKYTILIIAVLLLLCRCDGETPEVCILKDSGDTVCVKVEVARTPEQRQLGLMYRKSLPEGNGMLFIFKTDGKRSFTMKNTFIPLDIIFIDRTKGVAGWVENAKPLSNGPYKIDKPSQYVLEVNAFFCKENGIAVGDKVDFKNIAASQI